MKFGKPMAKALASAIATLFLAVALSGCGYNLRDSIRVSQDGTGIAISMIEFDKEFIEGVHQVKTSDITAPEDGAGSIDATKQTDPSKAPASKDATSSDEATSSAELRQSTLQELLDKDVLPEQAISKDVMAWLEKNGYIFKREFSDNGATCTVGVGKRYAEGELPLDLVKAKAVLIGVISGYDAKQLEYEIDRLEKDGKLDKQAWSYTHPDTAVPIVAKVSSSKPSFFKNRYSIEVSGYEEFLMAIGADKDKNQDMFKIAYYLEVMLPGEIVDTDGQKAGKSAVVFTIDPKTPKRHYAYAERSGLSGGILVMAMFAVGGLLFLVLLVFAMLFVRKALAKKRERAAASHAEAADALQHGSRMQVSTPEQPSVSAPAFLTTPQYAQQPMNAAPTAPQPQPTPVQTAAAQQPMAPTASPAPSTVVDKQVVAYVVNTGTPIDGEPVLYDLADKRLYIKGREITKEQLKQLYDKGLIKKP